jgi:hypothetical protein
VEEVFKNEDVLLSEELAVNFFIAVKDIVAVNGPNANFKNTPKQ